MDQLALKNLNTLLNINENTSIIFNNKEIIIVEDDLIENIDDNLNIEYTLYFTFNQLINIIKEKAGNKHQLIHNLNNIRFVFIINPVIMNENYQILIKKIS